MAVLGHLLRPVSAGRRAYSVFSKPGGGRYFNSAKPPKVAPAPNNKKVDAPNTTNDAASANDAASQQQSGVPLTAEVLSPIRSVSSTPVHPIINPQDLKLHQFFALHRPLLLASQPSAAIFEPTSLPFSILAKSSVEADGFEEQPEVSAEDDAETARQLARAMVVNRVGASTSWEKTLQRLGLDVTRGRAEEVKMAEAEFGVYLDSTKRKRRKKMKKHKLRKRRRLTRMREKKP